MWPITVCNDIDPSPYRGLKNITLNIVSSSPVYPRRRPSDERVNCTYYGLVALPSRETARSKRSRGGGLFGVAVRADLHRVAEPNRDALVALSARGDYCELPQNKRALIAVAYDFRTRYD